MDLLNINLVNWLSFSFKFDYFQHYYLFKDKTKHFYKQIFYANFTLINIGEHFVYVSAFFLYELL